jgi:hypothetical protein
MNNAIRQAVTTEIALSGINGTTAQLSWDHFYRMVLSTANFLIALPLNKTNSSARSINRSAMITEVVAI